jgi:hypothetical protein
VKLPSNLWTTDKENQRRLLQKLREGDLAAWVKATSDSVIVSVSWSQFDLEHPGQEHDDVFSGENEKVEERKNPLELIYQSDKTESPVVNNNLFHPVVFDNERTGGEDGSSEADEKYQKKKKSTEKKLKKQLEKEEVRKLKQLRREMKLKEKKAIKEARSKEEKARLKQAWKEKKKNQNPKKKEDLQRLKEIRQQKKLAKLKKKEEKNNKGEKK